MHELEWEFGAHLPKGGVERGRGEEGGEGGGTESDFKID